MRSIPPGERSRGPVTGRVLRPRQWRLAERNIIVGVSHPTNNPARHRVFEVRATFDAARHGWVARVGEQNLNEQRGAWEPDLMGEELGQGFPTAAACLGDAVTRLIATIDEDPHETP
jgi:hypothetical protein